MDVFLLILHSDTLRNIVRNLDGAVFGVDCQEPLECARYADGD